MESTFRLAEVRPSGTSGHDGLSRGNKVHTQQGSGIRCGGAVPAARVATCARPHRRVRRASLRCRYAKEVVVARRRRDRQHPPESVALLSGVGLNSLTTRLRRPRTSYRPILFVRLSIRDFAADGNGEGRVSGVTRMPWLPSFIACWRAASTAAFSSCSISCGSLASTKNVRPASMVLIIL